MASITQSAIISSLSQYFENVPKMWIAMGEYNVLLSGSRSLDYFFPGSCSDDSDFDFYVPANGHCIVGTIKELGDAGVIFHSPFDRIHEFFMRGGTYHLTYWEAKVLVKAFNEYWVNHSSPKVIMAFVEHLKWVLSKADGDTQSFPFSRFSKPVTVIVHHRPYPAYDHIPNLNVIRGHTTHLGQSKTVQLISAPKTSPAAHVLRFHSSAVQSFVSPLGAAHLYYKLTAQKQSYAWDSNTTGSTIVGQPRSARHTAAIAKYTDRGYTYLDYPTDGITVRHIGDDAAFFEPFDCRELVEEDLSLSDKIDSEGLIKRRTQQLRALTWHEEEFKTKPAFTLEPGPRARSLQKHAIFSDARDICIRYAVQVTYVSWIDPSEVSIV